ncbi:MAG TPA: ABC transporter permease subunit [Pseudonocardiaceae bacterium]|nr:ABC transporter permease subunit [Pseudonocardiaceae bacterium]
MGALITAEFRKILTTKLWWALLIPAVVLAFGWSFVASLLTTQIAEAVRDDPNFQRAQLTFQDAPWSVIALSRAINISTIFPMLFGALGVSSELHRRTITTSFLTASSRSALLSAKAATYLVWGIGYGVAIAGFAMLGTLAGSHGNYLPDAAGFLLIALAGVLSSVLWTMLGLGVGALLGSTTGSIVTLIIYAVIAEPIVDLFLHNHVAGSLPNGSADGLTGSTAAQVIIDHLHSPNLGLLPQDAIDALHNVIRVSAGALGAFTWWASALIFLAWTLVFFLTGMLINRQRDIT